MRPLRSNSVTAADIRYRRYGAVNEAGENLATCIWQSRKHAVAAMYNPKHAVAMRLAGVRPFIVFQSGGADLTLRRSRTSDMYWNGTFYGKSVARHGCRYCLGQVET